METKPDHSGQSEAPFVLTSPPADLPNLASADAKDRNMHSPTPMGQKDMFPATLHENPYRETGLYPGCFDADKRDPDYQGE